MKKNGFILWLLIISLILPGTLVEAKSTKKPKLNKTKLVLKVGSKKQLSIKNRSKYKIKKVTFSSSKAKIAKVTKKGKVKALRKGKATITCKVVLRSGKKYRLKCKVTVQEKKKNPGDSVASKIPSPGRTDAPKITAAPTGNPEETPAPTEPGDPQGSAAPSATGDTQGSTAPTVPGDPQGSTAPSEPGNLQGSTGPDDPQGSVAPTVTGNPQGSVAPTGTNTPATESPAETEGPTWGVPGIALSHFTLPPAPTFTPSPVDVPKVSHLSKNGITTLDNGVMRDSMDAYDIVWNMGLGTNLGNTMECCGDWINKSSVTNYETAWGAPVTTQEMLTGMKAAGFSSIRIPVGWSNMMSDDGNYTINEAYFNRVETIMNYALNADMYVVINIHFDGGWWARFGSKDANERKEAMKKYENMWLQIANRFQEYSDYVIFESANEELGERLNSKDDYAGSGYFTSENELFQLTNIINQTFVNVVRSTGGNNARRFLLIAGYDTNIDKTCDGRYQMPKDNIDSHLMVSIHYYSPATYCIASDPKNSWGYTDTWGSDTDITALQNELGKMRICFANKGYPVIIGEYGVTDSKIDGKDVKKKGRDKFFKTVCEYATANNMCPMLWDCNQVFDRRTATMTDEAEKANYLSISQSIKDTPVVKPDIVMGADIWSGKLSYSGWNPQNPEGNETNTFSIGSVGGCYVISGVDWSQYTNPVLKVSYTGTGVGDTLKCKFHSAAKIGENWTYIENDNALVASGNFRKGTESVVDLSSAKLSGRQNLYFAFSDQEEFVADFSITVASGK